MLSLFYLQLLLLVYVLIRMLLRIPFRPFKAVRFLSSANQIDHTEDDYEIEKRDNYHWALKGASESVGF